MFIQIMKCLFRAESSDMINVKCEPFFSYDINNKKYIFILLYSEVNRSLLKEAVHQKKIKLVHPLLAIMLFQTCITSVKHKILKYSVNLIGAQWGFAI